ncbi:MAG: four helix bundle protein [Planctomycetes bacterium]|nr:four helix bundle protein [Planctomycetota bacterium]
MPFMFEKLQLYQKAVSFAVEVSSLTESFPRGYGFLTDQLNRPAFFLLARDLRPYTYGLWFKHFEGDHGI